MTEINNTFGILRIPFVFDTGATYTTLNRGLADSRGWKVFQTRVIIGSYVKNGAATVCDLRKVPLMAFGTKQISDFVVATPVDDTNEVMNLLGRSFIDNFRVGIDQDSKRVYFKKRNVTIDPNYSFSRIAHSTVSR